MLDQSIEIFRALSDRNRLLIVSALASAPHYGEALAEKLSLSPSTVSFHLKKLSKAGLVESTKEQYYVMYRLTPGWMERKLGALIRVEDVVAEAQEARMVQYRKKVLSAFYRYGKLTSLPVQRKKRRIVLEEVAALFEAGRSYPEREVNHILVDVFDDFCTLRRELVGSGLMTRAHGIYVRDGTVPAVVLGDAPAAS